MTRQEALQILELPQDASPAAIRKAHRKLMKVWHPDRFGRDAELQAEAEQRTQQINGAYDVLKESGPADTGAEAQPSTPPEPEEPEEPEELDPEQPEASVRMVSMRPRRRRKPADPSLYSLYVIFGATCALGALVLLVVLVTLILRNLA